MNRIAKLRFNYEFSRVYRKGRHVAGRTLMVHFLKRPGCEVRVGVTVSRRLKGAVRRNRFKRLMRENYRSMLPYLLPGFDIILTGRALDTMPDFAQVRQDMMHLFKRAGLWQDRCDIS